MYDHMKINQLIAYSIKIDFLTSLLTIKCLSSLPITIEMCTAVAPEGKQQQQTINQHWRFQCAQQEKTKTKRKAAGGKSWQAGKNNQPLQPVRAAGKKQKISL